MRLVILKLSPILLTVRQEEHSLSFLYIILEVSLVFDPFIVYLFKVVVVELFAESADAFVVQDSVAIQAVLFPLSLVCDLPTAVVEDASALHPISHPFSTVLPALVVVESAEAMSEVS